MNHGPLPTRLAFISDLPKLPPGTKVRFLGCVTNYDVSSGKLTLQHAYPTRMTRYPIAQVDVKLLLENMKSADARVGEWVNVMGYIECGLSETPIAEETGRKETAADGKWKSKPPKKIEPTGEVSVQAVMLWSAGAVKLGGYETDLESRKSVESQKQAM